MPDQVIDKRTVGIPADVEVCRSDVEQMRDQAQDSQDAAAQSAAAAQKSEANAAAYEQAAKKIVDAQTGIHFAPTEPAIADRTDGMLWMVADEGSLTVTALQRWSASALGESAWPSDSTFPSEELYPSPRGAWEQYKLGAGCIA